MARSESNSIKRADLLDALNTVKPALGKAVFVPVLSHFNFSGSHVTAYDDSIAISVPCELDINCAVPGDVFLRLLGSLTAESVSLGLDAGTLLVKAGKSRLKVPTLPPEAFVFKEKGHGDSEAFVASEEFMDALELCLISVGVDPTHPAQMGVTLINDGDEYTLYSTDNVTISRFQLDEDLGVMHDRGAVILPTEFCRQLAALSKALDILPSIALHERVVFARFGEKALLFGKLVADEKPMDFASVFKRLLGAHAKVQRHELPPQWDSVFGRACVIVNPQHPVTSIEVDGDGMTIESKSSMGEVREEVALDDAPTLPRFLIDPAHVVRASKVCSHVAFLRDALMMTKGDFTHLISHCSE